MHSLSYRFGHHLGVFVVQARKALRTMDVQPVDEDDQPEQTVSLKNLAEVPAMVRKGINLNHWYDKNVVASKPPKATRKRRRGSNPVERKRGSLDPLL
ncbi:hypothetical protein [Pseudomonas sp. DWP3-1-2]|uniref:hypothetical protein n=1 Tax=Pseudomonas sp. DWP3-1-2 TaxID=2804645 RepID=UPI003CF4802F